MNFNLSQIPERNKKPRDHGITMVMDKGLSIAEAKNFLRPGQLCRKSSLMPILPL